MSHSILFSPCMLAANLALILGSSLACAQSGAVSIAARLGIRHDSLGNIYGYEAQASGALPQKRVGQQ